VIAYDPSSVFFSTAALVGLAEIGDKSQLVCMTLAARHRAWPVVVGAATAFLVLNALAVLFGTGLAAWMPERVLAAVVAVLFAAFGVQALRNAAADELQNLVESPGRGIFLTTLLLVFVAAFGDKTQLAVAGLAVELPALPVWLGASVALIAISALGAWAGRTVLQRLPLRWLHRIGGGLFLLFAGVAAWRALA